MVCSKHFLSGRQARQTSVQCRRDLSKELQASMPMLPVPHLMALLLLRLPVVATFLMGKARLKLVIPGD